MAACAVFATGSLAARDITVAPGDSLAKARDAAKSGDRIVLKGGTHRLEETLLLGPENSGVTWAAAPGEKPVISGGVPVTGWTPDKNGVWRAKIDHSEKIRQLIVNGRRAQMAQTESPVTLAGGWGEFSYNGKEPWVLPNRKGKCADGMFIDGTGIPEIARPEDLEVLQWGIWTTLQFEARGMTEVDGKRVVQFRQPVAAVALIHRWQQFALKPNPEAKTFLLGVREFVDQPGEFCFETATKTLYYMPREGDAMEKADAIAPVLETLVRIQGKDLKTHAANISFENITFADTRWGMMKIGDSHGDVGTQSCALDYKAGSVDGHDSQYANLDLPCAAIEADAADHLAFRRNTFIHTGALGLSFENDVLDSSIVGNIFRDTGSCAINVGHPQHVYIGKQDGDNEGRGAYFHIDNQFDKRDEAHEGLCKNITISNNLIRSTGTVNAASVSLSVLYGHGIFIEHNDIADAPYTGISLGWGWQTWDGISANSVRRPSLSLRDNSVCYNKVGRILQKLRDGGGIYLLANQSAIATDAKSPEEKYLRLRALIDKPAEPGDQVKWTPIFGNHIYGFGGRDRSGIHPDNGAWFFHFKNNVVDLDNPCSIIKCSHVNRKGHYIIESNWSSSPLNWLEHGYKTLAPDTTVLENFEVKNHEWPAEAKAVMENAGLEPTYRDLLEWEKRL